jgi:hypothetical protein
MTWSRRSGRLSERVVHERSSGRASGRKGERFEVVWMIGCGMYGLKYFLLLLI